MTQYIKLAGNKTFIVPTFAFPYKKSFTVYPGEDLLIRKDLFDKTPYNLPEFVVATPVDSTAFYFYAGSVWDDFVATRLNFQGKAVTTYSPTAYFPTSALEFSLPFGYYLGYTFPITHQGTVMGKEMNAGDKLRALVFGARRDHPEDWEVIDGPNSNRVELPNPPDPTSLDQDGDGIIDNNFLPEYDVWDGEEW